jgi:hypothetical protein
VEGQTSSQPYFGRNLVEERYPQHSNGVQGSGLEQAWDLDSELATAAAPLFFHYCPELLTSSQLGCQMEGLRLERHVSCPSLLSLRLCPCVSRVLVARHLARRCIPQTRSGLFVPLILPLLPLAYHTCACVNAHQSHMKLGIDSYEDQGSLVMDALGNGLRSRLYYGCCRLLDSRDDHIC